MFPQVAVYEELQNLLNPVTDIRVAAEGRMKQLEITEGIGLDVYIIYYLSVTLS